MDNEEKKEIGYISIKIFEENGEKKLNVYIKGERFEISAALNHVMEELYPELLKDEAE